MERLNQSWARALIVPGHRFDVVTKMVRGGQALLDIGCGNGLLTFLIGDQYAEVHGIDHDRFALRTARLRGVDARFFDLNGGVDVNGQLLPFPDERFDTVTCLEVIEHVQDPLLLMMEIARIIKSEGEIFISSPNIRFVRFLQSLIIGGRFPVTSGRLTPYRGGHLHHFTHQDIEDLAKKAGLQVTHQIGLTSDRARQQLRWKLVSLLGRNFEREFLCVGLLARCIKPIEEKRR